MPGGIELRGKRVLVVGLARTGVATALFCAARGARVTATDSRTETEIGDATAKLKDAGVTLELGGHREKTFGEQDLIVPSPGVPADEAHLQRARAKDVTSWSEIELALPLHERPLDRNYWFEREDDDDFTCRTHFEDSWHADHSRGKYWNAAHRMLGRDERRHLDSCRTQQLPTGAHRHVSSRYRRVSESDARSSR